MKSSCSGTYQNQRPARLVTANAGCWIDYCELQNDLKNTLIFKLFRRRPALKIHQEAKPDVIAYIQVTLYRIINAAS